MWTGGGAVNNMVTPCVSRLHEGSAREGGNASRDTWRASCACRLYQGWGTGGTLQCLLMTTKVICQCLMEFTGNITIETS